MSTRSTTVTTTTPTPTLTMRASQRVLLEAFPVPPSHVPQALLLSNPPPTGPPSFPLPPVPGPSRISVDEQLLFLSSVAQRSRRSSRYSNRESILSVASGYGSSNSGHSNNHYTGSSSRRTSVVVMSSGGSPTTKVSHLPTVIPSRRDSVLSSPTSRSNSPRAPSFYFPRPAISVSAAPAPSPTATAFGSIRLTSTAEQQPFSRLAVSPVLLSDIEDDEADVIPSRNPSPFLDSSWRRSKHHHNESISSIDVRDILRVDADGTDEALPSVDDLPPIFSRRSSSKLSSPLSPPSPHSAASFFPERTVTSQLGSTKPTPTTTATAHSSLDDTAASVSESPDNYETVLSSTTIKDLRMEMRAERTKSAGLKMDLTVRSRSRSIGDRTSVSDATERPSMDSDTASTKTAVPATYESRNDQMTLEELGPLLATQNSKDSPSPNMKQVLSRSRASTVTTATIAFPIQKDPSPSSSPPPPLPLGNERPLRTPSPDIDAILSSTPRPRKSPPARVMPQGIRKGAAPAILGNIMRRRASEGVLPGGRPIALASYHGHGQDGSELAYSRRDRTWSQGARAGGVSQEEGLGEDDDRELEKVLLQGQANLNEASATTEGRLDSGEDSDSSIDLHTPLPHLMVRHGLLSPRSRLLPSLTRSSKRSDSVTTASSVVTKSGIMKDERDTPMRRVRHRDNRLLRGGIGLTTGLGWSDSEDEDSPSPLTRRLSTLNLSRRSSASSLRTMGSVISRRHPLSRSYSSGALVEREEEEAEGLVDELNEDSMPPETTRPHLPKTSLPPTSWQKNRNSGGNRTSSGSSIVSFEANTTPPSSDTMVRLRPSKMTRPGSSSSTGLRNSSSGSSAETHDRALGRKRPSGTGGGSGEDRTSSSTTSSSTASFAMPVTPKDRGGYDPAMSSPAHLGMMMRPSFGKEKSLPPLPLTRQQGVLKKKRSNIGMDHPSSMLTPPAALNFGFPRTRTFSSSSSSAAATSNTPSPTVVASTAAAFESTRPAGVRPLHLPRQAARTGGGADRPAVPVPSVSPPIQLSSSLRSASSSPQTSESPTSPILGFKPRPRTGTGMMYRTSSAGSRIKVPMTLASSNAASVSVNGTIGRANGSRTQPL